jgi:hypothetical protein
VRFNQESSERQYNLANQANNRRIDRMGRSVWHNRCFHDCFVHVVLLGFGENRTLRRSTNVDGSLGSSSDDHGEALPRQCYSPWSER